MTTFATATGSPYLHPHSVRAHIRLLLQASLHSILGRPSLDQPRHLKATIAKQLHTTQCSPPCNTLAQNCSTTSHQAILPFWSGVEFLLHGQTVAYYIHWPLPKEHITPTSLSLPRHGNLAPLLATGNIGIQCIAPGFGVLFHEPGPAQQRTISAPFLTSSFPGIGRHIHKAYPNINPARIRTNPPAASIEGKQLS